MIILEYNSQSDHFEITVEFCHTNHHIYHCSSTDWDKAVEEEEYYHLTMALLLILLISLSTSYRGLLGKSNSRNYVMKELGKAIDLRKRNLLDDFTEYEGTVFKKIRSGYLEKKNSSRSYFDYYKNTKAFYSKTATGAGFDASLQSTFTLGVTLSSS